MTGDSFKNSLLVREVTVLGGGLSDAVIEDVGALYGKLPGKEKISQLAQSTAENPVGAMSKGALTVGKYIWDHKVDAAAGAAIAFVGPKKWWNAGLLLWSSQGLITATGKAGMQAAISDGDLNFARSQFKGSMQHELKAFAGALPMTMVGGFGGRTLANGVFGRGKSLTDFDWSSMRRCQVDTALSPELGYDFHYGRVTFAPHEYNPAIRKAMFEPSPEFAQKARADLAEQGKIDFRESKTTKVKDAEEKVTLDDVLRNLDAWRMKKLLVHDLDNAAYRFPEGYLGRAKATDNVPGEGIEKAISMMQQKLAARGVHKTDREIALLLGETMELNRTHDGPWQVEQSPIRKMFPGNSTEFHAEIVKPFWEILDKSRENYLTAFEGSHEILAEFVSKGGRVTALSDAPLGVSLQGLRITKLDSNIKNLLSMEALEPAAGGVDLLALESGRLRVKNMLNAETQVKHITELQRHESDPLYNLEKPHAAGIDIAIADARVRSSQALVIDDSRVKGGGAAVSASGGPVDFVYFGGQSKAFLPVHEVLNPEALSRPARSDHAPYKVKIDNYSELRRHLYPQYGSLLWNAAQRPGWNSTLGYNLFQQNRRLD